MKWLLRLFSLLGLLTALVVATPVVRWWATWLAGPWNAPEGEILIVLGADDMGPGILGYSSYLRAYYALRAWQARPFKHVLLLGRGASEPMRAFLLSHGLPPSSIKVETESTTTYENARAAASLLAGLEGRRILLSSDFHMRRASATFARQGVRVTPSPFPDVIKRANRWSDRCGLFSLLAEETVKLVWYRWKGIA